MLCIARRDGQRVRIGPDIIVTVYRCARDSCRLAIDAPPSVRIERLDRAEDHGDTERVKP